MKAIVLDNRTVNDITTDRVGMIITDHEIDVEKRDFLLTSNNSTNTPGSIYFFKSIELEKHVYEALQDVHKCREFPDSFPVYGHSFKFRPFYDQVDILQIDDIDGFIGDATIKMPIHIKKSGVSIFLP